MFDLTKVEIKQLAEKFVANVGNIAQALYTVSDSLDKVADAIEKNQP